MGQVLTSFLTAALTIIGGVLVHGATQLLSKLVIDPVNEQRRILGEIDYALTYFARCYANPKPSPGKCEAWDKAAEALRDYASRLTAATNVVRLYRFAHAVCGAPARDNVFEAASCLISISNNFYYLEGSLREISSQNVEDANRSRALLKLPKHA
jgi:hypothetical protein